MNNDFIIAEVEGKAVLIDTAKGLSFYLNETGFLIFKLLRDGKSPDEIKSIIMEQYDVEESEIKKDIEEFMDVLKRKRIQWERKDT